MKKYFYFILLYFLGFNFIFSQETEIIPLKYDTSGYLENNHSQQAFTSTNDAVSTINADMNVNSTGALTYTIPIEVFSSINNFQPNIALGYNSQTGNGQVSWGWNIIGLSCITQGSTSQETEGITRGMQFNDTDPFYLDGQRLLKISDNTFETQIYSNLKITKNTEGYSFIVKYPDGKIGKYKQLVYGQHYISVFSDAMDNEIHYEYTVINNIPYIKSISYGSTSATADPFKIEFIFKDRAYSIKSYRNGTEVHNNKIVSQIIISSVYDGIYRKYNLTHDILSNQNERLRIVEIENGQGEKLKPLHFTYNTDGATTKLEKRETSNKGLTNTNVKSLGHVAIGNFHNTEKPYPVYNMETFLDGYKILDAKTGKNIDIPSDSDTQLFTGKTLLNQRVDDNDHLIAVNTEFTGDTYNNGYYTPKIKVKITTKDILTNKNLTVFFNTNGYYEQNLSPKDNECTRPSIDPNIPSLIVLSI